MAVQYCCFVQYHTAIRTTAVALICVGCAPLLVGGGAVFLKTELRCLQALGRFNWLSAPDPKQPISSVFNLKKLRFSRTE